MNRRGVLLKVMVASSISAVFSAAVFTAAYFVAVESISARVQEIPNALFGVLRVWPYAIAAFAFAAIWAALIKGLLQIDIYRFVIKKILDWFPRITALIAPIAPGAFTGILTIAAMGVLMAGVADVYLSATRKPARTAYFSCLAHGGYFITVDFWGAEQNKATLYDSRGREIVLLRARTGGGSHYDSADPVIRFWPATNPPMLTVWDVIYDAKASRNLRL